MSRPFEVERVPGGIRYILPPRSGPGCRVGGAVLTVIGCVIVLFMAFWMKAPLQMAQQSHSEGRWFSLIFALFGLVGLVPGLGALVYGLGLLTGNSRCELEVVSGTLRLTERVAMLRWSWRRKLADIERVVFFDRMNAGSAPGNSVSLPAGGKAPFGCLALKSRTGKPLMLGFGYPSETLKSLSEHLVATLNNTAAGPSAITVEKPVVLTDAAGERDVEESQLLQRPPVTDIELRQQADGIAISVPPMGLRRGSRGLFAFSCLWLGFMAFFVVATGVGLVHRKPDPTFPIGVLGVLLFCGIGVATLLSSIQMGRQRMLLAVTGGQLAVRLIGPIRSREWRFAARDLADVRMAASGMEVNNRPVMELQIRPKVGKKVGLLRQRTDQEQLWLAAALRDALGLRPGTPPPA